jgi:hypothetical protein
VISNYLRVIIGLEPGINKQLLDKRGTLNSCFDKSLNSRLSSVKE